MNERQAERLSPLPEIGEGFGEWSEAPSYEEGVGVDGGTEGLPSEKALLRTRRVLGRAKRAKLERGEMRSRRVQPCKMLEKLQPLVRNMLVEAIL